MCQVKTFEGALSMAGYKGGVPVVFKKCCCPSGMIVSVKSNILLSLLNNFPNQTCIAVDNQLNRTRKKILFFGFWVFRDFSAGQNLDPKNLTELFLV